MSLPYGPLAGNTRISARINQLLPLLAAEDQRKFLKKFRNEADEQAAHTFRELILGVFLLKNGLLARYEVLLDGKKPDWILYDSDGKLPALVDQLSFHQAKQIDEQMNQALRAGSSCCGWLPDNAPRLYQKLLAKAEAYEQLTNEHAASNIVSIFGDFNAAVESDELAEALHKSHGGGVFAKAPWLSGVIYFQENSGTYAFQYFANPDALRPLFIAGAQV